MRLAVTCVTDQRLKLATSLILRHLGYRVIETDNVQAARRAVYSKPIELVISGALADPDEQLAAVALEKQVAYARVATDLPLESLLKLLERYPAKVT